MRRRGFDPVYEPRGQVLVDLAVMLILGGEAISDFQGLRHLAPVTGPVPSSTRGGGALDGAGDLQLARVNAAVTRFRRYWWGLLAGWPEGLPVVAGRQAGADRDHGSRPRPRRSCSRRRRRRTRSRLIKAASGSAENLATCDNTGDMLAIDPRPGGATPNCAADNIALLDLADVPAAGTVPAAGADKAGRGRVLP